MTFLGTVVRMLFLVNSSAGKREIPENVLLKSSALEVLVDGMSLPLKGTTSTFSANVSDASHDASLSDTQQPVDVRKEGLLQKNATTAEDEASMFKNHSTDTQTTEEGSSFQECSDHDTCAFLDYGFCTDCSHFCAQTWDATNQEPARTHLDGLRSNYGWNLYKNACKCSKGSPTGLSKSTSGMCIALCSGGGLADRKIGVNRCLDAQKGNSHILPVGGQCPGAPRDLCENQDVLKEVMKRWQSYGKRVPSDEETSEVPEKWGILARRLHEAKQRNKGAKQQSLLNEAIQEVQHDEGYLTKSQ